MSKPMLVGALGGGGAVVVRRPRQACLYVGFNLYASGRDSREPYIPPG